ncbi:MAG TPA: hypothetical protein VF407_08690 [Polyangiaceae bacterium]
MNVRALSAAFVAIALFFSANRAHAQIADAGAPMSASVHGCVESIPPGGHRPQLEESFPAHGKSGYAQTLVVKVKHGKGETVLPRGLDLANEAEAKRVLKESGFVVPDQDGGAGARLTDAPPDPAHPDQITTIFELPLLALPEKPGRTVLVLPPLPVAVSRSNGEIVTTCTTVHAITIDDPIASTPDAKPKPNPPPRPQREEWSALERVLEIVAIVLVLAIALAYVFYRWSKRPKPVPPPPPPRPAWEVALESLDEIRHAGLLDQERYDEYFDRVSDTVRNYLGARFGFDGLESTTDEVMTALRKAPEAQALYGEIGEFCRDCDLVKFANMTPDVADCAKALDAGEKIVRKSMVVAQAARPVLSPLNPQALSGEDPQAPKPNVPPPSQEPPT